MVDWKDRVDIRMHGDQEAKLRAQAEKVFAASQMPLPEEVRVPVPDTHKK